MFCFKKILFLVLSGFVFLVARAEQNKTYQLALNWLPEPQFGGFYQALFSEEFKKNNLDVEVLKGGSGTPTIQMVTKGTVDFAIVSAEEILISNERNPKNPVIALFATFQKNPQMIMSHAERGFKSIGEIFSSDGLLAWQHGLSYALFLRKKYPQAKVKLVPYLGGLNQFQKNSQLSQQGFITSEPLAAEKLGIKVTTFLVANEGFNPYTTVLVTKKNFFNSHKEVVNSLVKAVKKGWEDYIKNPESTNKKMNELNPSMDIETFKKSAQAQIELITNDKGLGIMDEKRWAELIGQMQSLGLIKKKLKAENQFINL